MKITKIVPFIVGATLSVCVSAATTVTHTTTDPITGIWHATTGAVTHVGNVLSDTWHGVVHGTTTSTTRTVHHTAGGTTAVHHTTTTRVYH